MQHPMKRLKSKHAASPGRKLMVIKAALACFTERGYTDTTISDVCAKSGMSVGSLYHHFKSKEQLAAAVYLEGIRDYQQGYVEAMEKATQARTGVKAIIGFHLRWVEKNRDWARYLFQQRHAGFMGETVEDFNRLNAEFFKRVSAWFKVHIASGEMRRLPFDLYMGIMMGPCQEFSRLILNGSATTPIDKAFEVIGDAAWRALAGDKHTENTRQV